MAGSGAMTRPLSILVIEDNPDDAFLIGQALKGTAWKLDFATDGTEALKRFGAGRYDVVVLDYLLNDMTGTEVLVRIRERDPQVPVIMASGADSRFIAARAIALGIQEFVNKDETDYADTLMRAIVNVAESKTTPPAQHQARRTLKERAQDVKAILTTFLESTSGISTIGIVGPDGALVHSAIKDRSGANDVTAVLAGTVQMMLTTVASHLGLGSARSFVASFDRGIVAMAPLTAGLVLFISGGASAIPMIESIRNEIEVVRQELMQVLGSTATAGRR
jgi:CheY-like chemotaxis protein